MPKVITSKDLIKILKEYGYIEHYRKCSHCMLKNIKTGKYVVVSCHNKDLGVGLTLKIWGQAGINRDILRQKGRPRGCSFLLRCYKFF